MLGGLLAAGSSLIRGFLNRNSQRDANAQALSVADRNIELQREFAKNGVRWKVKDAQKAGVHPLFALGANTHSFSPVSAGVTPENGLAEGFANAGQNLGRAIEATRTADERHRVKMQELELERGELENTLIRSEIMKNRSGQVGPPMAGFMPGEHDQMEKAYGFHQFKKGIERGFLYPPNVDEDGNQLIYTAPGEYAILPHGVHSAERAEDLLGELGGIPHQVGIAGQSAYDYVDRLLLDDLRSNWNRAGRRWKRFWKNPDLGG